MALPGLFCWGLMGLFAGPVAPNQLVNPGAETGDLTGWTVVLGQWQAVAVGSGSFDAPHAGRHQFFPGAVAQAEMFQDVDVSALGEDIAAGKLYGYAEMWLSGWNDPDAGELILEFRAGQRVLATHRTGLQTRGRNDWAHYQLVARVPRDTATVRLRLRAQRQAGNDCDVYFDDLRLELSPDPPPIPRLTRPPGPSQVAHDRATLVWTTDVPATTQVEYGPTEDLGRTATVAGLVTHHTLTLTGLTPATVYHYRVVAANALGEGPRSSLQTFATQPLPTPQILKGPYLQNVTPEGITVMWETHVPGTSQVAYGTEETLGRLAIGREGTLHEVRLEGLQAETTYYYQVRSENEAGAVTSTLSRFRTAPRRDTPFRVLVWGDNRTDYETCDRVCQQMARMKPDLVVSVGDVVTNGQNYDEWGREYFLPIRHFAAWVPSFIAIGNHENDAHWFDDFVDQPGNEHWFAFTYGHTRFVLLDTNRPYGPDTDQYRWLRQELASEAYRKATFRLAFFHHPPYSEQWDSPGYDGEASVREHLVPLLEEAGVDIVFAGHTHDYERGRWPLNGQRVTYYVITGGGGSALDRVETKDWPQIQMHRSVYHFSCLDLDGPRLHFRAIDVEGEEFDSFVIEKGPGA